MAIGEPPPATTTSQSRCLSPFGCNSNFCRVARIAVSPPSSASATIVLSSTLQGPSAVGGMASSSSGNGGNDTAFANPLNGSAPDSCFGAVVADNGVGAGLGSGVVGSGVTTGMIAFASVGVSLRAELPAIGADDSGALASPTGDAGNSPAMAGASACTGVAPASSGFVSAAAAAGFDSAATGFPKTAFSTTTAAAGLLASTNGRSLRPNASTQTSATPNPNTNTPPPPIAPARTSDVCAEFVSHVESVFSKAPLADGTFGILPRGFMPIRSRVLITKGGGGSAAAMDCSPLATTIGGI